MIDIETLKALAKRATPGPWRRDDEGWILSEESEVDGGDFGWPSNPVVGVWVSDRELDLSVEDGEYIAAANPEVILSLIDKLQRTAKELEDLRAVVGVDTGVDRLAIEVATEVIQELRAVTSPEERERMRLRMKARLQAKLAERDGEPQTSSVYNHPKALIRARNEGLEKAAQFMDDVESPVAARRIRALKEPES